MSINQSKNKVFTKGLSPTESSVLAIVKRYFENNSEELYGSVDSIVFDVLRRVKEDIINGTFVPSVTSINGKVGEVTINAEDVGAEPKIETKGTAFNKDFGKIKGTVCEGNDPRLSDARTPKSHHHEEYLTRADMDNIIESFLNKNGITIFTDKDSAKVITIKGNLVIKNGEITEE